MKLYEFTFNDNMNLAENEVLALANESLKQEAEIQGWAPGYNLRQLELPKKVGDNEIEYFFVVEGEVLSSGGSGDVRNPPQSSGSPDGVAASP